MKKLLSIITCIAVILAMMPSMAFAEGTDDIDGAKPSYTISSTEQFKSLVTILNAGAPADESTVSEGTSTEDYAKFGIEGNFKTAFTQLKSASYKLKADIDLSSDTTFTGIKEFAGDFDGGNHKIKYNINIEDEADGDCYIGLFNKITGDSNIKNVVIEEGSEISIEKNVEGRLFIGSIYGDGNGKNVSVENCISYADITVNRDINGPANYVGGIAGYAYGSTTGCDNYGDITYNSVEYCGVAGIAGFMGSTSATDVINNCKNYGTIKADRGDISSEIAQGEIRIAGLVGHTYSTNVSDCENHGDIIRYGMLATAHGVWAPSGTGNRNNLDNTGNMVTEKGACSWEGNPENNCYYTITLIGKPGEIVTYSKDTENPVKLNSEGRGTIKIAPYFTAAGNDVNNSYYMEFSESDVQILLGVQTEDSMNPVGLKSTISSTDSDVAMKLQEEPFKIDSYDKLILLQNALSESVLNDNNVASAVNEFTAGYPVSTMGYPAWAKQQILASSDFVITKNITIKNDGRFKGLGTAAMPFAGSIDFGGNTVTFDNIVIDAENNSLNYGFIAYVQKNSYNGTNKLCNGTFDGSIKINDAGGSTYVGAVIGYIGTAYLAIGGGIQSNVDLEVTAGEQGQTLCVGGLFGRYTANTSDWWFNNGDVTVHSAYNTNVYAGGIIGKQEHGTRPNKMVFNGNVTVDSTVEGASYNKGNWYVGGLSGSNAGYGCGGYQIINGNVSAKNTLPTLNGAAHDIEVGGVVGYNDEYIYGSNDIYTLGNVTAENKDNDANVTVYAGGIYGYARYFPNGFRNTVDSAKVKASNTIGEDKVYSGKIAGNFENFGYYHPENMNSFYCFVSSESEKAFGAINRDKNSENCNPSGLGKIVPSVDNAEIKYADQYDIVKGNNINGGLIKWETTGDSCIDIDDNGRVTANGIGTCRVKGTIEYLENGEVKTIPVCNTIVNTAVKELDSANTVIEGLNDKYPSADSADIGLENIVVSYEKQQNINGQITLEKDVDYTISNDRTNNKYVIIFKGGYSGTIEVSYSIDAKAPEVSAKGFCGTYDAAAHTIDITAPKGSTITFTDSNVETAPSFTNVGKNEITYSVTLNEKTVTGKVLIEILPAVLSIKADDKTIFVGDNLPEYTYSVSGLQGEDTLTTEPTIRCTTANKDMEGEYPITISGAAVSCESDNYSIRYTEGTLTVSNKPIMPAKEDSVTNTSEGKTIVSIDKSQETANGNTVANVTDKIADKLVESAVNNQSKEIVIDATSASNTTSKPVDTNAGNSAEIGIPEATVKAIAEKTDAALTIKTDVAEATLDTAAVKAVADKAGDNGTVKLVVEVVKADTEETVVDLKIVTSKGTVSDFKGGNVSVTIALDKQLQNDNLVCVYIDSEGIYHKVDGTLNDDGTYTFVTGHFSTYAVMAEADADKAIADQLAEIKASTIKLKSVKGKGYIKLTWSKKSKYSLDGYEVYRGKSKASLKKWGTTKKTSYRNAKYLKKGNKYYYKVRGYKVVDGRKIYTRWSNINYRKAV